MDIKLLRKQHDRATFYLEMIEQCIQRVEYYERELALELGHKFIVQFQFYSKEWHLKRIKEAKELSKYCIGRYNKLKLEL